MKAKRVLAALFAAFLLAPPFSGAGAVPPMPVVWDRSAPPDLPDAESMPNSGSCGGSVSYTLDQNGTLLLSGAGDMTDYTASNKFDTSDAPPWHYHPYLKYPYLSIGRLSFAGTITRIGDYTFSECENLRGGLALPGTLRSIGTQAFRGCSGFTGTLLLPNRLASVGDASFAGCSGFTGNLILPDSVTEIGNAAFSGCTGMNGTLRLPSGLTRVSSFAFDRCENLRGTLSLPETLTSIGTCAFNGCRGFSGTLVIPESVVSIGYRAFAGCTGLTSVRFDGPAPASVGEEIFGAPRGNLTVYCAARYASTFTASPAYDAARGTWHGCPLEILPDASDSLPGDVNADKEVTRLDLTILSRALADWPGYEERIADSRAADLNSDGSLTAADRMLLARLLSGQQPGQPGQTAVTESVRRTVPHTTEEIPVDTIPRGDVLTLREGADGESIFYYTVTYRNGVEIGRRLEREVVVTPMVPEQAEVGVGGTLVGRDGKVYSYSWRKICMATYYNNYGYTYSGAYVSTQTAATNFDYIPIGTRMYIKNDRYDFGYRVSEDTGPLGPWHIDIWMPDDDPNAPLMSIEGLVRDMEVYFLD